MANGNNPPAAGEAQANAGETQAGAEETTATPAPAVLPVGAYRLTPTDRDGKPLWDERENARRAEAAKAKAKALAAKEGNEPDPNAELTYDLAPGDPNDHRATDIFFGVLSETESPPKDQMDLQDAIGQVLATVQRLYLRDNGEQAALFRIYYIRLYRLAQLGLEGVAMPEVSKAALDRVVDDLILAEGPRVKNLHLRSLGKWALWLSVGFSLLYFVVSFAGLEPLLELLRIEQPVARSFMILWIGSFIGVWLSYAIRKTDFKLRDLIVTEDDMLEPGIRLIFAGLLANVIGMVLLVGFVQIKIGSASLDLANDNPTMALLLGMVLGINELLLPKTVATRSRELFDKLQ
jgi:multisubunit Na+/H+ antiporter MnhE subunit